MHSLLFISTKRFEIPTFIRRDKMKQRERHEFVLGLIVSGHSDSEVYEICRRRGEKKSTIYDVIKRVRGRGHADRKVGSGRKRTVREPKVVKQVRERIRRNPRRSMRKLADELKISDRSIRRIVHDDLKMKAYKRRRVAGLTAAGRKKRLARCRDHLLRHARYDLERMVFFR